MTESPDLRLPNNISSNPDETLGNVLMQVDYLYEHVSVSTNRTRDTCSLHKNTWDDQSLRRARSA
jgi:hypothetical protein